MTDTANAVHQSTPAVDAEGAALASRNRMALILLLAAVFVVFLNETMMNVALPEIQESTAHRRDQGQWLTTAFALTMAVVIPITGWLMQRLNTRPVFLDGDVDVQRRARSSRRSRRSSSCSSSGASSRPSAPRS